MPIVGLPTLIRTITNRLRPKALPQDDERYERDELGCGYPDNYEDALLDAQLRHFLKDEYGKEAPHAHVFSQLSHGINLYNEEQARRARAARAYILVRALAYLRRQLAQLPSAVYRLSQRPMSGRLLSGSVVAAMLVLAVVPKMAQSLHERGVMILPGYAESTARYPRNLPSEDYPGNEWMTGGLMGEAPAGDSAQPPSFEQQRLLLAQRIGEDPDAPAESPAQVEDSAGLHPVELGMARKVKKGQTEPTYLRPADGQE